VSTILTAAIFGSDVVSRVFLRILCVYSGIMHSDILSRRARNCVTETIFKSKLAFIALTVGNSQDTILDS
jgi:hypothetical protein